MNKLHILFLVALLSGCSSTTENATEKVATNTLDLRNDITQTENFWVVAKRSYPIYPTNAARQGISGCVEFSFVISKSGKAQNIQIIKAVPERIFNKAALKSLREFRWTPANTNISLNPVLTTIQLDFATSPKQAVSECISS
jgi:TonB family protein